MTTVPPSQGPQPDGVTAHRPARRARRAPPRVPTTTPHPRRHPNAATPAARTRRRPGPQRGGHGRRDRGLARAGHRARRRCSSPPSAAPGSPPTPSTSPTSCRTSPSCCWRPACSTPCSCRRSSGPTAPPTARSTSTASSRSAARCCWRHRAAHGRRRRCSSRCTATPRAARSCGRWRPRFAVWCLPQVFFYGMYTLLGQVLNARGSFGPYMWAPVVNNVVAIAGLGGLPRPVRPVPRRPGRRPTRTGGRRTGSPCSAARATLGVVCQAVVLVWPLHRIGFRYRPRWRSRAASGSAAPGASRAGRSPRSPSASWASSSRPR